MFSTYQSSELIVEAQKESQVPNFDIVFADEAHKCAGKISKDFSYVLDNKKIRANKRLFFTATPRVLSKRIKKQAIKTETEIASMDDPLIFGEVLHAFRFSDAIKQKVLTDYQVVVIGIDDILISEKIKNRDFIKKSDGEIIDAESLALQIALAKGIKKYDLNRIINFHSLIEGAKLFRDTFEKTINEIPLQERPSGKISCDYVEGKMTTEKRNEKIENLRNLAEDERKILGNAKCLSEGVDVPSLDGITFVDPKSSEVDIIQAVGRVIRYDYSKKEQKKGTILIPIYLQDLTNIEDQVLESRFSDVWEVIKALKFHDDVLKENIDNLRISFGKRKSKRGGFKGLKIHTDLPTERISINFINSIETLLIKNTSDDWLEIYGMFIEFKNEHGHVCPPVNDTILGRWCGDQRERYKKGQLSQERITLLNDVGFDWDPLETEWQRNFEEVKEFKKINGHTNINTKTTSLGQWCLVQRRNYRKGKLLQKRVDQLNSIGFDWDPNETYWQNRFEELKEFKKINGHTIVPTVGTSLGKFVVTLRMSFKRGKLSQKKIDLLNSIGFDWDPVETEWQSNFEKLKEFKKKYGHFNLNTKTTSLGKWCMIQRKNYRKGDLLQTRVDLLNSIGFDWDPLETEWQDKFKELKEFKKENGHANPLIKTLLGRWCLTQRSNFRKGKLSQERINLLNSIGFDWDPLETDWQNWFKQLKEFKNKNGNKFPPFHKSSLGRWCLLQRSNYKKGKLSKDRIELLESIGFEWY